MKKKLLLSLATVLIGGSTIFGFSSPASADGDVNAGPIWNNADAKVKCPKAVASQGNGTNAPLMKWTGQWHTTVWGKESVCSAVVVNPPP